MRREFEAKAPIERQPAPEAEPVAAPATAILPFTPGVSNAAFARVAAATLQRQPPVVDTRPAPPMFTLPPMVDDKSIHGPLEPGKTAESEGLTVTQKSALHAEIAYGDNWVRIDADPGATYAFAVGPPIEGPPAPKGMLGPLIDMPDPDAKPPLRQRVVHITGTGGVRPDWRVDDQTRVPPLAIHFRTMPKADVSELGFGLGLADVIEWVEQDHVTLQLEDTMIRIGVDPLAHHFAGDASRARYAYWIDPEWTGSQANEKRVVIVAAPGVSVKTGSPAHAPIGTYGRKLVEEVVRVPHPNLVPEQGTRLSPEQFVGIDVIDPNAPSLPGFAGATDDSRHGDEVDVATGMAGVVVFHPSSGARLTLRPRIPSLGGAYAWEVIPPLNGQPGEIRAVVGPEIDVELQELVPTRLLDPTGGATPTPKKGQASAGEGLHDSGFELKLVEVPDPANVPQQGTPLNMEHLAMLGGYREPDRHVWLGTDDLPYMMATAAFDTIVSFIPIVGQLYMIGEFAYTMATGHDWWGNEVDDGGKALMGVGAVLSLIPLVGGLSALLRGGAKAAAIAEFAARWGTTAEELQVVLLRVGTAVEGEEAVVVQRAMRAIEKGGQFAEEDIPALQRVLAKVGAGKAAIGLERIAVSATGKLELALVSAGESLRSEEYLTKLVGSYRTAGTIPEELVSPLARSGRFASAEEAEAAVEQALRDLARAQNVTADEAMIREVAGGTGRIVGKFLEGPELARWEHSVDAARRAARAGDAAEMNRVLAQVEPGLSEVEATALREELNAQLATAEQTGAGKVGTTVAGEKPLPTVPSSGGTGAVQEAAKPLTSAERRLAGAERRAREAHAAADRAKLASESAAKEVEQARKAAAEAKKAAEEAKTAAGEARLRAQTAKAEAEVAKPGTKRALGKASTQARDDATRAEKAADKAAKRAQRLEAEIAERQVSADKRAATAAKRVTEAEEATKKVDKARALTIADDEAPRLAPGEKFDPKKRRPELGAFADVEPASVTRGGGKGDFRVRIFKEEVPARLRAEADKLKKVLTDPKATQVERQAAGHEYERLLGKDLTPRGDGARVRSTAGDKLRIGDEGIHEFTLEGQNGPLGSNKLDQLWRDLVTRDQAMLTVPALHADAEKQLAKLAAIYEHVTEGRKPLIIVRTTLP